MLELREFSRQTQRDYDYEETSLSYRPFDAHYGCGERSMGTWLVRLRALLVYRQSRSMQWGLSA
jgi:hypothetical protein